MGTHHGVGEKRETDEQKAERLVVAELRKRRWTEQDLGRRRKTDATDATKVKVAARLRAETVVTLDWIAERLQIWCHHPVADCLKD
ncbi:MAG: hypothetical protein H7X97_02260 [Opitutaceae bacterium]|nr:hypothetical protein [Verrucomicrobiales bacterium]